MKKARFYAVILAAWRNVSNDMDDIRELIERFEAGKIQACKARKEYARLKEVFCIDGDRFAAILAAAKDYDSEAFRGWTLAPVDAAVNEFVNYFEQ